MVPGTQKVKVIYGMGRGTAQIGQVSPVANKMLALFGEGGADLGTPQVIVLPDDIHVKYNVRCLTDAAILTAFQGGNQAVDQPVARANAVTNKHNIMHIAPIPAYLVFDGFETDLDSSMVYERLMDIHDKTPMIEHALEFVKGCMVGGWRIDYVKPFIPHNEFYCMVHYTARIWANSRFAVITPYGTVGQQQQQQPGIQVPQGQGPQAQIPAGQGQVIQLDATALQALFAGASVGATRKQPEEKKDDSAEFKISDRERARMQRQTPANWEQAESSLQAWIRSNTGYGSMSGH